MLVLYLGDFVSLLKLKRPKKESLNKCELNKFTKACQLTLQQSNIATVGGVCNFLGSVSSQQKFEVKDQCYSSPMGQCYSSWTDWCYSSM